MAFGLVHPNGRSLIEINYSNIFMGLKSTKSLRRNPEKAPNRMSTLLTMHQNKDPSDAVHQNFKACKVRALQRFRSAHTKKGGFESLIGSLATECQRSALALQLEPEIEYTKPIISIFKP